MTANPYGPPVRRSNRRAFWLVAAGVVIASIVFGSLLFRAITPDLGVPLSKLRQQSFVLTPPSGTTEVIRDEAKQHGDWYDSSGAWVTLEMTTTATPAEVLAEYRSRATSPEGVRWAWSSDEMMPNGSPFFHVYGTRDGMRVQVVIQPAFKGVTTDASGRRLTSVQLALSGRNNT